MVIRCLVAVLATLAVAQWSMAESGHAGAGGSQQYRLSGVLISDTRKSALLNNRLVHEGSDVGGAVIEAIERRQIQIRVGSTRQIVRVGGSFMAGPSENADRAMMVVSRTANSSERPAAVPEADYEADVEPSSLRMPAMAVSRPAAVISEKNEMLIDEIGEHVVSSGETLSGIALRYKPDGITINQMMVALFKLNPLAFNGNINALSAGATLRLPRSEAAIGITAPAAMAEVTRQHERWRRDDAARPLHLASTMPNEAMHSEAADKTYGPVQRGETLSQIALDISRPQDGFSTDQLMIALYRSNPHAFGQSIDVVYEGALLQLPDRITITSLSPAAATDEVHRQRSVAHAESRPDSGGGSEFDVNTIVSAEEHELLKAQHW